MSQVQATIAQQQFAFDTAEVGRRLHDVLPEPLGEHYVVVAGKRFPPKQVISLMTGLDRADFNTHQARRILSRLGFTVGRRSRGSPLVPSAGAARTTVAKPTSCGPLQVDGSPSADWRCS
jgi:hypothetical protein